MSMFVEDIAGCKCAAEDCECDSEIFMYSICHDSVHNVVSYVKAEKKIRVLCGECSAVIAEIAVASRAERESIEVSGTPLLC